MIILPFLLRGGPLPPQPLCPWGVVLGVPRGGGVWRLPPGVGGGRLHLPGLVLHAHAMCTGWVRFFIWNIYYYSQNTNSYFWWIEAILLENKWKKELLLRSFHVHRVCRIFFYPELTVMICRKTQVSRTAIWTVVFPVWKNRMTNLKKKLFFVTQSGLLVTQLESKHVFKPQMF